MRNRGFTLPLRWVSVFFVIFATALTAFQLVRYSRIRTNFPPGMVIAGIPVGGLDTLQASERLLQAYTAVPVEVHYRDAVIQIRPSTVGFTLDLESMMSAADLERVSRPFWTGFWEYLWDRTPVPDSVPLIASLSEERLRDYLQNEIATRYDEAPTSAMPVPGSTEFQSGEAGIQLDVERAVVLISDAFRSPSARQVNLAFSRVDAPKPSIDNLKILLQEIVQGNDYVGTIEMYVKDLQSGEEVHFAYDQGQLIQPDIAFTAASTMKIPIMISVFLREPEPLPQDISDMISLMIEYSENGPADELMETVLDRNTGPLMVTEDMQTLGLENTFLAGYFYTGAPLLQVFSTPANQRTDITTDPDLYNQTTPTEIGMLLEDIYYCAEKGGGTFEAVYPGQLTKSECQQMISFLSKNRNGVLLESGVPEGTQIAHKHGWIIESDNLMHTISDAGIVYSPGGNYVISIYLHNRDQLVWDGANLMVCNVSEAIYNYFNLDSGGSHRCLTSAAQ
jgi:beta-lactamase class A